MKIACLVSWTSGLVVGFLLAGPVNAGPEAPSLEKLPPGVKIVRVEAQPPIITLKNPYDYKQLILTGQLDTGDRVDLTRLATFDIPGVLLNVSPRGQVRPVADGNGQLRIAIAGQTVAVPVTVTGQKVPYNVSFVRDVMPTMSKLGCNAGTCHGAQKGKNGFKLSLRGYDPLFDFQALTDDLDGRRFDRASPDHSLMLLKPSGGVPHVGGSLMHPGDPAYDMLRSWIAAGVKLDLQSPRVKGLDIFPKTPMIPLPEMKQQFTVLATYTDGSVRDVTAEAFVESSNTEVATGDKQGLVTAVRRGETTVLARFEGSYTATPLIVMGDRSGYVWKPVPEYNFIDTLVDDKLKQVKVLPGDLCTDAEFLRRVYLDLNGLPPLPNQVRAFLADPRPTQVKRDELVDKLIGSPEFVEHWTNKWADLLQVNRKFLGEPGAAAFRNWIRQAVATDMPYDKFAYTILTAAGSNLDNPPASYYKTLREPGPAMENTTQLFLGVRFNCNKCHDHPFERWTQDQYYHLAAYFAQVGRAEDPKFKGQKVARSGEAIEGTPPLVEIISDITSGEVVHERTGVVTPPSFPFQHPGAGPASGPRRMQLARWIASRDNPYFAKSYVNRIWSYLLGVGLIEPVDDIRAGNPPSNPRLLDQLTADFVGSGFDTRHMVKLICMSRTYQMSIETNLWNKDDDLNYSHALARRLPAEVLYDAIHRATGSVSHLPGLPAGASAAQLLDSDVDVPGGFFVLFGKPPRESACECERSSSMMLGPVLNLVNGPVIADALKDSANRISKLTAGEMDDRKVIEELFLAILCRPATPREIEESLKAFRASGKDFADLTAEYSHLQGAVAAYETQVLPVKQAEWEKSMKNVPTWTVVDPVNATSKGGATLTKQPDGSILASGKNSFPESYTISTKNPVAGITAIRLKVFTDPSLPSQGPGRATNGNFVLSEFRVTVAPLNDPSKAQPVVLTRATADYSQPNYPVAAAIDGNLQTGWAIAPAMGQVHSAIFETKDPMNLPGGALLTVTLDQEFAGKDHTIGRFQLAVTNSRPPFSMTGLPDPIARILKVPVEKRTNEQKAGLTRYYRTLDSELARLNQTLARYPKPPADPRQLGAQDLSWALLNSPAFQFNH